MAVADEVVVQIRADVAKARSDVERYGRSFDGTMKGIEKSATRAEGAVSAFGRGLLASVSVTAIAAIGKHVLYAADQYRTLQGRIREATRSTGDFNQVSEELFAVSQRTGTELENNVSMFQRLAVGAREFGATNDQILELTETVQKLGIIGGTSASSIAAGTQQFAQAMAAGVVRAEEWNSIVENMPELANAIAAGFGKTGGQMRKMILDGKVLSREVFKGLIEQTENVAERYEALPTTIEQATTRINNAFTKAAGESKEFGTAVSTITDLMTWIANNMDQIFGPFNQFIATTRKEFEGISTAAQGVYQWLVKVGALPAPEWTASVGREWKGSVGFQKPASVGLMGGVADSGEESAEMKKARREIERFNQFVQDTADDNRMAFEDMMSGDIEDFADKMADGYSDFTEEALRAAEATREHNAALDEQAQTFLESIDPIIRMNAQLDELALISDRLTPEQLAEGIRRIREEAILASETMEGGLARSLKSLEDNLSRIDVFSGDIFGNMGKAFKQAINDMISEAFKLAVIKPLFNSIFSGLGGGGGGGGFLSSLGGLFGGARASGGPVSAGKSYLVGEKGPEIVRMGANGNVIPNNQINMGGGGGQVINQTINVDGRNSVTPQDFARQIVAVANEQAAAMDRNAMKVQRQALPGQIDRIQKLGM